MPARKTWRIAGINFDHLHMGDLLRLALEHPRAEVVGVCDETPPRIRGVLDKLSIPDRMVYSDYRRCLEETRPDIVMLCPATSRHAEWTEYVAPYGTHVLVEKPFAASLAEADRMIAALETTGKQLVINWPLRWYPPHVTAKRLVDEGAIGELREVHYYDGNRGPLFHVEDKEEVPGEVAAERKKRTWFYRRADGGGSLLDYLGYGTTLATWYLGGRSPQTVTCMTDRPEGLEVDEHSVTVARYDFGLSTFQTRWGTFTDPWTHQPQPKCGFVLVGRDGTISTYDYEQTIRVQTSRHPEGRLVPVDTLAAPERNVIEYFLDRLERGAPVEGPVSPAIARIGQQMVDAALESSRVERAVPLPE